MPTTRTKIVKRTGDDKPAASQVRTKPRVEDTESGGHKVAKSAEHRRAGTVHVTDEGVYVSGQRSELVPVAQYANVTLGPIQLAWKLGGIDMAQLAQGIDWESYGFEDEAELRQSMTDEQRAVYDTVMGSLEAASNILDRRLAMDRAIVEESVRLYNERAKQEKSK